jgi:ABC-2 type transport system ATP-binding protein
MIEVEGLRKRYGDLVAVDDVSFRVEPGEVFGLLGPNGAGKTTTLHCVCGLLTPGGGRVRVLGRDVARKPREAKASLGVVPQELALYDDLSARENLAYWGAAYGLRGTGLKARVNEVLERIGLLDRARDRVKGFSGGMKRRLNFGCGVVHRPKVLLLDEPTVGVDPQSRVNLLDMVREEAADGTAVLYTTHYMEEAQSLCRRLAIVDHGRIMATGTLDELRELVGERDILQLAGRFDPKAVRRVLESRGEAEVVTAEEDALVLAAEGASKRLPELLAAVSGAGGEIRETTLRQPSLETLFIKLTGRELRG